VSEWFSTLEGLQTSISVILRLTRELSIFKKVSAASGDYLIEKPDAGIQLIRIKLFDGSEYYPEISAGRHRIAIHFYALQKDLTKIKITDPVEFSVCMCGWK